MKFSIRDLFLVTMIVALVLGWVLDHWRLSDLSDRSEEQATSWQDMTKREHDNVLALERKLDEVKPGWRRPRFDGDKDGYHLGRDQTGPYVYTADDYEKDGHGKLPTSQTSTPNPPKP